MNLAETLRTRKGDWTGNRHLASLNGAFENAMTFIGAASAKRRALEAEGKLSVKGVSEAVREFADSEMTGELRRIRGRIGEVQAAIAERRAKPAMPKIDKTDAAAAVLRSEARAFLRAAGVAGHAKALLGDTADPLMLAAVMEAPEALSGVTGQMREQAITRHLEAHHAADLREIAAAEAGLAVLRAAVTAAEADIRESTGSVAA